MEKAALILEGGALRSFYTMGVLDALMENKVLFEYVCGVSGGALSAMNYLSQQKGRTVDINQTFLEDKRYKGVSNLFKHRSVFNLAFLFGDVVEEYTPFDYETYKNSPQIFEAVATQCESGETYYFKNPTRDNFNQIVASASIPFASKVVMIDHKPFLDGGVSNPLPIQRAIDLGYQKIVVVLTQDASYWKKGTREVNKRLMKTVYHKYPNLVNKMIERPDVYNECKHKIQAMAKQGEIIVIQPSRPVKVSRFEKDQGKLLDLYHQGLDDTNQQLNTLINYLEK